MLTHSICIRTSAMLASCIVIYYAMALYKIVKFMYSSMNTSTTNFPVLIPFLLLLKYYYSKDQSSVPKLWLIQRILEMFILFFFFGYLFFSLGHFWINDSLPNKSDTAVLRSKDNICQCIHVLVNELAKYFKNLEATLKTTHC